MDIANSSFIILSPSLGCPHIVGVDDISSGSGISLIIAGRYGEFSSPLKDVFNGLLFLRPSNPVEGGDVRIPLIPVKDPEEMTDWNSLTSLNDADDTRELINSELHYNVLGENTRYWRVEVSPQAPGGGYASLLNHGQAGRCLAKLYDLVLLEGPKKCESVKFHAVQFVESRNKGCNFIHLTDLHVAKRNDEILDEVLKVKNTRDCTEIERSYVNFNDKLREFIRIANGLADKGELDFVVITGDLVDFAFLGWEDCQNSDENNWKTFVNIITGGGKEGIKGNPGIKVAAYTSTGNHDWRVHPYNPCIGTVNETYGLEKDELKNYDYKSFDSKEFRANRLSKASDAMVSDTSESLNLDAFLDKRKLKIKKYAYDFFYKYLSDKILLALGALGLTGSGAVAVSGRSTWWFALGAAGLLAWPIRHLFRRLLEKEAHFVLYNPLLAESASLHYYMKHVNPYLDYAFQYGDHTFIVMDTGADVFTGELMKKTDIDKIKKMSVEDNVFGGSPDSRGFDSEQCYCNWSQIVWLEKALEAIGKDNKPMGRSFVFLHSPPINPPHDDDFKKFRESCRSSEAGYITREDCNLTFGTINNYLSEFYHLCTGSQESRMKETDSAGIKKVDIVFSGHAHRNIEFRIERVNTGTGAGIRIYSDVYSDQLAKDNTAVWWEMHRPVILQTAACGVSGRFDENPPYYRKVSVDSGGVIKDFRVWDNTGVVNFGGCP